MAWEKIAPQDAVTGVIFEAAVLPSGGRSNNFKSLEGFKFDKWEPYRLWALKRAVTSHGTH
jgi:hypothetical protein